MSAEIKKNIKEELPKKIINALIENYSLKSVIDNIYNKHSELDGIQSSILIIKNKKGLPYLTNILYDFKDKLVLSDIKQIPNNKEIISLHEKNENIKHGKFNSVSKNGQMVIEK